MRKNDKRKYLSPKTEIVRFNVDDIITTSGTGTGPEEGQEPAGYNFIDNDPYANI